MYATLMMMTMMKMIGGGNDDDDDDGRGDDDDQDDRDGIDPASQVLAMGCTCVGCKWCASGDDDMTIIYWLGVLQGPGPV